MFEIRKATRKKAKARIGISGPSGSGKTYSALLIAFGLCDGNPEPKVGVIDTENSSAELYAPQFEKYGGYYVINLLPPYDPEKYIQAIHAFEQANFDVIIIDSLSHAWAGTGGLLERHSRLVDSGNNSFTAWREVSPLHNKLVETIITSPAHIIATFRAKTEYVVDTSEGKAKIIKAGMAPIQRSGIEYEFTTFFELEENHQCKATKDRTGLFDQKVFIPDLETGRTLKNYLESGEDPLKPLIETLYSARTLDQLKSTWERIAVQIKNMNLNRNEKERLVQLKNELKQRLSVNPQVTPEMQETTADVIVPENSEFVLPKGVPEPF